MAKINNMQNCTGCGACFNICPHGAIQMIEDERGFLKPFINDIKCVNCGLCEKTCPVLHYEPKNFEKPKVFAFINNDEETRLKSASGSVFPAFAKYVLGNNGVAFGVIYDDEMKVCHSMATNWQDIEKMQSSKYVQSDTKDTYKKAKHELESGRFVLFTGTPCQIAGLKSYLKKDYENLLTIDLICHGVPSRKVFEKYNKEFMQAKKDFGKILNINMRSKIKGWLYALTTTTTTPTTTYHTPNTKEYFMQIFLSNLSINDSCCDCQFNKLPRVADITMGDFWGVEHFDISLDDKKGTSIVLLNSTKGKKYFDLIKEFAFIKEVPLDVAVKYNPTIYSSSKPHPKREDFFEDLLKSDATLSKLSKKYIKTYPFILKLFYKLMPKFIKNWIKTYYIKK